MKYTWDNLSVSDLYKDAYGVRPHDWFWEQWSSADDDRKQAMWDTMVADLRDDEEQYE